MLLLRLHFCNESSWDTMTEEAKQQMVALAATMLPTAALGLMRPHDPNKDGPFGNPFAQDSGQVIDPNLEMDENM